MFKNLSGQKLLVFAFDRDTAEPVLSDAAQITCKVAIDNGTATALTDVNPVETEDGRYLFDLTTAETNGDTLDFYPESSTSGVQVIALNHDRQTVVSGTVSPAPAGVRGGWFGAGWFGGGVGANPSGSVISEGARSGEIAIALIIGDDYKGARALVWDMPVPSAASISGSTCSLKFVQSSGACDPFSITFAGALSPSETSGYALMTYELLNADTQTIIEGEYQFFVIWTTDLGEVITKVFNRQLVNWKSKDA